MIVETEPKPATKSSILIGVEIINEDGNVRVNVRSGVPINDTDDFTISAKIRAMVAGLVLDELKKFMPRNERG